MAAVLHRLAADVYVDHFPGWGLQVNRSSGSRGYPIRTLRPGGQWRLAGFGVRFLGWHVAVWNWRDRL